MVLLIDSLDILKLDIKPIEVIEAIENAYRQSGLELADETPRLEIKIKGKNLPHIAPGTTSVGQGMAYLKESNVLIKSYAYHFDFHKYINEIIDTNTGQTLAVIKRARSPFGNRPNTIDSGMLRTGAAAAIGAKYMAKEGIDVVGIIGTGRIGRGSLVCLNEVLTFDKVLTHSGRKRDYSFSEFMQARIPVDIIALDSIEEVVRKSDIIVTGTYATEPVVKGEWVSDGTHISGMGADGPKKAELDTEVFRRANRIIIDSLKCLSIGEMVAALDSRVISLENIQGKIGDVVAGKIVGRESELDITLFESDGTHIQSAAVVNLIYKKAKELGFGKEERSISDFFINP